jgi:hypothetical protein
VLMHVTHYGQSQVASPTSPETADGHLGLTSQALVQARSGLAGSHRLTDELRDYCLAILNWQEPTS